MALIRCKECGKEISENAVSCPNCGAKNKNNTEKASTGLLIICFLIPLVGIILFAINISNKPKYAKGCLIASLLPTIICIIAVIIIWSTFSIKNSKGVLDREAQNFIEDWEKPINSTNKSTSNDNYLPYCKYSGCYNRVSYSWREYCDKHSYMEY